MYHRMIPNTHFRGAVTIAYRVCETLEHIRLQIHSISEQNGPSEPGRNWPRILALNGVVRPFSPSSPSFH
jgi:hypothetical protein